MPSRQLFVNNARATLAAGISAGALSVTVNAGEGARFGTPPAANEFIKATLRNAAGTVTEIVHITGRTGDTLTIVRAQEGTAASAFSSGDTISVRFTAGGAQRFAQKDADEAVTGAWSFQAPTSALHPATKQYVDARLAGLTVDTLIDPADLVMFRDVSASLDKVITQDNLRKALLDRSIQAAFRASSSASTPLPNSATTNIALASESFDSGNNFSSNQYVVPRTGLYLIQGTVYVTGTPGAISTLTCYIRVDTGYFYIGASLMQGGFSQVHCHSGALLLSLVAGQTVGLAAIQNSGATLTAAAGASNVLSGVFIREF